MPWHIRFPEQLRLVQLPKRRQSNELSVQGLLRDSKQIEMATQFRTRAEYHVYLCDREVMEKLLASIKLARCLPRLRREKFEQA